MAQDRSDNEDQQTDGPSSGSRTSQPLVWPCAIAVDVGGTFTDLVLIDGLGRLLVAKVPSVPSDPSQGVLHAVEEICRVNDLPTDVVLSNCSRFVHGSTVATNAVLERKLATVGLITTEGFRDALEIRRGIRENQWDHRAPWPPVVVPRSRRLGVAGRIDHRGVELQPLDEAGVEACLDALADDGVEAVAISLLHSYANPMHEQRVADLARRRWPGDLTVASSELVPLLGEYERTSTAVINAGLVPLVGGYLRRLADELAARGLRQPMLLMQSNGGTVSLDALASRPVHLMLSGPAAVGGALRRSVGESAADTSIISMEIGGTSCDVAVMVDGTVSVIDGLEVGGYHLNIPAVDVHTIGAGGGTLASVDVGGLLRVGPQGAGADPGPASYGRGGTEPTATDAHLILGRLRAGRSAGGAIDLDETLASNALESRIAEPLGLTVAEAAIGQLTILEQHLRQAVETITIERGRDPANMVLVAAGGAGGLHGSSIARSLGCRRLVIPSEAGVFCAVGMLHSNLRRDVSRSLLAPLEEIGTAGLLQAIQTEQAIVDGLTAADWPGELATTANWHVDLRYPGQLWSVRVATDQDLTTTTIRKSFEAEYERLYGHYQPDGVLEVTGVGITVEGHLPTIETVPIASEAGPPTGIAERRCWLDSTHKWQEVTVYDGSTLGAGTALQGPYLIEAATTTVLGLPGDRLAVQANGDYLIELT
ncbi:MAG: hydantoinase/oxoprolinase family protein [Acidimicrobiales bacterium]